MWKCQECGKENRDDRVVCWRCETGKDGSPPADNRALDEIKRQGHVDPRQITRRPATALGSEHLARRMAGTAQREIEMGIQFLPLSRPIAGHRSPQLGGRHCYDGSINVSQADGSLQVVQNHFGATYYLGPLLGPLNYFLGPAIARLTLYTTELKFRSEDIQTCSIEPGSQIVTVAGRANDGHSWILRFKCRDVNELARLLGKAPANYSNLPASKLGELLKKRSELAPVDQDLILAELDRRRSSIPELVLAQDADAAWSLIRSAEAGEAKMGLSTDGQRIFFVTKQPLSPSEVINLCTAIEQGRVRLRHRLFKMSTYPVFVLKATIQDDPTDPFSLETLLDIGNLDKMILQCLTRGSRLGICFHFYDPNEALLFRAGYEDGFQHDRGLRQDIVTAGVYLDSLPPSVRNFQAAVQQLIQENP